MLSGHRQSQIIVNWPLKNQSPGAARVEHREGRRMLACVYPRVSARSCRGERSKSILNLPGLGNPDHSFPQGGLHPEARREMGPRTRA